MFSLIITILSITLVALIAVATLYFGGDAWASGKSKSELARLLNTGAQIGAAFILMKDAEPNRALSASGLPPAPYLASEPAGWSGACVEQTCTATKPLGAEGHAICLEANELAGLGRTLDLTVYTMATSRFYCVAQENESGQPIDYLFTFNSSR